MKTKQNKKNRMKNERGSTLVGALLAILMLGYFGATVVELGAGDTTMSGNEINGTSALYIGQAGLEYAKVELYNGLSPDVAEKTFSDGSFTITSDALTGEVTAISNRGNGERIQTITADFSDACVTLDTTTANVSGDNLYDVKLIKSCNGSAIVDKITINWSWTECEESEEEDLDENCDTDSDGDIDYDDFEDPNHEGKILICHIAGGNENTLSIAVSGWEGGHDQHEGDYLGECGAGGGSCELTEDSEESDESDDSCADEDDEDATVEVITLDGTTIYDGNSGIGSPLFGAGDDEEIDVEDTTLSTNGTYTFGTIQFSTTIPTAGSYEITVTFADGSQISATFQVPE